MEHTFALRSAIRERHPSPNHSRLSHWEYSDWRGHSVIFCYELSTPPTIGGRKLKLRLQMIRKKAPSPTPPFPIPFPVAYPLSTRLENAPNSASCVYILNTNY